MTLETVNAFTLETKNRIKGNWKRNRDKKNGAPERIRTFDRSVRSRVLYPAELRVRSWRLIFSDHFKQ